MKYLTALNNYLNFLGDAIFESGNSSTQLEYVEIKDCGIDFSDENSKLNYGIDIFLD